MLELLATGIVLFALFFGTIFVVAFILFLLARGKGIIGFLANAIIFIIRKLFNWG